MNKNCHFVPLILSSRLNLVFNYVAVFFSLVFWVLTFFSFVYWFVSLFIFCFWLGMLCLFHYYHDLFAVEKKSKI